MKWEEKKRLKKVKWDEKKRNEMEQETKKEWDKKTKRLDEMKN